MPNHPKYEASRRGKPIWHNFFAIKVQFCLEFWGGNGEKTETKQRQCVWMLPSVLHNLLVLIFFHDLDEEIVWTCKLYCLQYVKSSMHIVDNLNPQSLHIFLVGLVCKGRENTDPESCALNLTPVLWRATGVNCNCTYSTVLNCSL
jgi:hypothetical protein